MDVTEFVVTRTQSCSVKESRHPINSLVEDYPDRRLFIVADLAVAPRLAQLYGDSGLSDQTIWVRGGERLKNLTEYANILGQLEALGARRRDLLVCVGGSTVSDLGGFVAATYLRGISYVNVPTTVLAQVDGAVGGKVAINSPRGKNAIGAFWHPEGVLFDIEWFMTLPRREISNGLAESVKVGCLDASGHLLRLMRSAGGTLLSDPTSREMLEVVRNSIAVKSALLRPDPFELDLRRVLNLGHSVAHPLETHLGYVGMPHGFAVAIGVATALRYGVLEGLTDPLFAAEVDDLLATLELPTKIAVSQVEGVLQGFGAIRRVRGGAINYVVPQGPGRAQILSDIRDATLRTALVG